MGEGTWCLSSPSSGGTLMAGKGTAGLCRGNTCTKMFGSSPQFKTKEPTGFQPSCSALVPAQASSELGPVSLPSVTIILFLKSFCCVTSLLPVFAFR